MKVEGQVKTSQFDQMITLEAIEIANITHFFYIFKVQNIEGSQSLQKVIRFLDGYTHFVNSPAILR